MELNKRERNTIYDLLISEYPSSYMRDSSGLRRGIGSVFSTQVMSDDSLIKELESLSNISESRLTYIRKLLKGIHSERRICGGCSEPFGIKRANQKYCHKRCRWRVYQRQQRSKGRQ